MSFDDDVKSVSKRKLNSRLFFSIATGVIFFAGLIYAFQAISLDDSHDDAPAIVRYFYRFNEAIGLKLQSETRLSVEKPKPPKGKPFRVNGDEGMLSALDTANYQVEVDSGVLQLHLTPEEFQKHPATEVSTDFKCIEGWSEVIHYKGLKFSDFMNQFNVGKKEDGSYYKYVAMETPDGDYYVSIDMKSMLHPQTVLAYEINDAPLTAKNGAPLRLVIPIKYGVKSIKRIGRISFSDERPQDFWTEQGYDWYSGL